MTENEFWRLIAEAHASDPQQDDVRRQLQTLTDQLASYPRSALLDFELILRAQLKRLYHARVLELYILLFNHFEEKDSRMVFEPIVSDDGFLYFRCWLILQGAGVVDAALQNPEQILDHPLDLAHLHWGEDLLTLTEEAQAVRLPAAVQPDIRDAASESRPDLDYDTRYYDLQGGPIDRPNLDRKYPKLAALARALRQ